MFEVRKSTANFFLRCRIFLQHLHFLYADGVALSVIVAPFLTAVGASDKLPAFDVEILPGFVYLTNHCLMSFFKG